MRKIEKGGLSPVVATVLLIAIALILAVIVFLWARSFIGERTQKEGQAIENFCPNVLFEAEATRDTLKILNKGNVAIFGVEIKKKETGSIIDITNENAGAASLTVSGGETKSASVSFGRGNELIIIPKILGEAGAGKKAFTCDVQYGREITVA